MNKLTQRIELASHIAIIIVAVLIGAVLVKSHLLPDSKSKTNPAPADTEVTGKAISLPGMDWKGGDQTLMLILSVGCRFCTESAPFYKELIQKRKGTTRLVAVLPQPIEAGKKYLADLGINVDEVRQAQVNSIGVRGTPTLL